MRRRRALTIPLTREKPERQPKRRAQPEEPQVRFRASRCVGMSPTVSRNPYGPRQARPDRALSSRKGFTSLNGSLAALMFARRTHKDIA